MLSALAESNLKNIEEGIAIKKKFDEYAQKPMEKNTELLMEILRDNKDTEYGRRYDFEHITSVEEYQRKVPVSRYDDYVEAIIDMTNNGTKNLICAYPINHYNKSSGTMGNPKKLPMSEKAIEVFNKYATKYIFSIISENVDNSWIDGKTLCLAESLDSMPVLPSGATYGAVSQKTIIQYRPYLGFIYTSPDEAVFPKGDTNTKYLHARFGLMSKEISVFGATFYSYGIELLRYIEHNWRLLTDDIANGTIDESIKMPQEVREQLMERIKPMPERADELREIFSQGFSEPFMPKVWPKLKYIQGVGTGGFKAYGDMIREKYTGLSVKQLKVGLTASEGVYSVPIGMDREDTALIPDSVFYEFLPLDAGDDFSKIVTLDNVEIGKDYELIITNLSGFYRYRMRDAIRIVGKYYNVPTIEFLHRIDQTVSIMGEKTTEDALRMAVENTAKQLDIELVDYSMYPDIDSSPVRYVFFFEVAKMPQDLRPKEIRFVLEQNLAKANPSMGDKVKKGICGPTKLNFLEPEAYSLYRDLMISKGAASGQLKPVRVINNEIQRKFFFGVTEYGVDGKR
jgi:hypothetical protein